jgi:N-acetylmuramoyl-L-alanine amidase
MKKLPSTAWIITLALLFAFLPSHNVYCETNILNVRHWAASDHTRIVIDTSEDADIKISRETGKVSIEFRNAHYSDDLPNEFLLGKNGLEKIQIENPTDDSIRIVLTLREGAEATIFKLKEVQDKPFRIVIDLKFPEIEKRESEERHQFKMSSKDKIVIIDPGHGGEDPGAIGFKKTMEKDVVLKIAKKLEWLLNNRKGYRAFLTRDGDYYPAFKKRLQIAKEYGADLFISIHADASLNRKPCGSSVYCLSTSGASSAAARLLARQENLADIVGGSENEANSEQSDPITLHMIQTETINMSKSLGMATINKLKEVGAIKFSKVQEAPLIVLKLPHIPSILVESGYISNPKEELLLKDNRYQNKIALALCYACREFLGDPEQHPDSLQIAKDEEKPEEPKESSKIESTPKQEIDSKPLPRMILYKVRKGDSIESIARKHGTTPKALLKLNHLRKSDSISGKKIKVYLPATENKEKENSAESPKPIFYVVKKGDSLSKIAVNHGTTPTAIMALNKIKPGAPLYVDLRLRMPVKKEHPDKKNVSSPAKRSQESPKFHVVKKGESLAKIAQRYNISLGSLLSTNNMKMKDALWVGKKIKIPEKD